MVLLLITTIATSLVPYKSPCWSPASFTPDVMQSEIRTPIALGHRYKRNYLFLTSSLLHYEASVADSLYSTLQQTSTGIIVPVFPYRSPQWKFPPMQHKVICKLLLTGVCGRSNLFFLSDHRPVLFARPPHDCWSSKKSSIFCTASSFLQLNEVQDTHVCA